MADLPVHDFKIKSIVHDYEVKFIEGIPDTLATVVRDGDVVIIDKIVDSIYPSIQQNLKNNTVLMIDAVEASKSYEGLKPVISKLIESGFRKNHRLIGIGGGITQDITAFTASTMYRGVQWLFFPTTLLAQADSCIGSKTSINFGEFKNQLGGFYPPNQIFIDMDVLDSLHHADLQSGFGEMSHYFVIAGETEFKKYKNDYSRGMEDKHVLANTIAKSLEIKKGYIEIDEFDTNERQIFNYGHSFGHAIESLTNYDVPHGIAVSIGMDMANFISVKMNILDETVRLEIRELLQQIWVGYDIKHIDVEKFCRALAKDKKNVGKELRLILCRDYGNVFKTPVKNDSTLNKWLEEYLKNEI
jgi:3-dehydroquinate synthase